MSTPLIDLRKIVYDAIVESRRKDNFIVNGFEVEETYFPWQKLADIPDSGKVWVIGLAGDDSIVARSHAFQREVPIQIALQHLIRDGEPKDRTCEINRYVELEEQLRDCVRLATKNHKSFAWVRTEALKDENGTPFNFAGLREANTFEAFFTAYFKVILE